MMEKDSEGMRRVAIVGVLSVIVGMSGQYFLNGFDGVLLVIAGGLMSFTAWGLKERSSPPVSVIEWLLVGETEKSYSEMSEDSLRVWENELEHRLRRRQSVAGKINSSLFHGFEKRSVSDWEDELEECRAALREKQGLNQ